MTRISNKKAFYEYEITDTLVAGISLIGSEVKSLRQGRASLAGSFVSFLHDEAFLKNFQIQKWEFSQEDTDPMRVRKLLLRKREILKFQKKAQERGWSIVPLAVFFDRGFVKVEIGLGQGKKSHDKRRVIKEREQDRRISGNLKKHTL